MSRTVENEQSSTIGVQELVRSSNSSGRSSGISFRPNSAASAEARV